MAIRIHLPSLKVVLQINFQSFIDHAFFQLLIEHGKTHFYTAEEIAVHPIGTAQIHVMRQIIAKVEYSRVFQKTANYRAHTDILG